MATAYVLQICRMGLLDLYYYLLYFVAGRAQDQYSDIVLHLTCVGWLSIKRWICQARFIPSLTFELIQDTRVSKEKSWDPGKYSHIINLYNGSRFVGSEWPILMSASLLYTKLFSELDGKSISSFILKVLTKCWGKIMRIDTDYWHSKFYKSASFFSFKI
jgi:hypothetical protein